MPICPPAATYTWQVRYEDNGGIWSGYSTATSFTMSSGPTLLTLPAASAYYLQDSANGQSLNVWNSSSNTGTPSQTIALSGITKIAISATAGSNITLDFSNGNLSPQNRLTITGNGSSANNVLSVIGARATIQLIIRTDSSSSMEPW